MYSTQRNSGSGRAPFGRPRTESMFPFMFPLPVDKGVHGRPFWELIKSTSTIDMQIFVTLTLSSREFYWTHFGAEHLVVFK